ncbi:MAG: putative motility protein [Phycisphaerales bacterium]|nr:putative motility protein [Phycisphaerales bacterium]
MASRQAQISQQASLKAAKMAMDIAKDSGTRLIESLIKSANATQAVAAKGLIDVLA